MSDPRNTLESLFSEQNRHANFGECLVSMKVHGFRCHSLTLVEFRSPITAFCGLNGTGKSTILQLAAVAYGGLNDETGRYGIKDFIVSGPLDPNPFADDASVQFGYWQPDRKPRLLSVTRRISGGQKGWGGYNRQPRRSVYFAGMGLYLPKIEQRDFVIRHATKLEIGSRTPIAVESRQWAGKILGCGYDTMDAASVTHENHTQEVVIVARQEKQYSELNMGCGEGRVLHLIRLLGALPEKSLVLLEEPETALHQSAQYEFGLYLMDICIRRKHQILMTTHSPSLLSALPSDSRIYVDRSCGEVRTIPGISASQIVSLLTGGQLKALNILVEDDVAEVMLKEILRKRDPDFLRCVSICACGDRRALEAIAQKLKPTGIPIVVVRDGDTNPNPSQNVFSLPGSRPPEEELFENPAVADLLRSQYNEDLSDFRAGVAGIDHHYWFDRLAQRVSVTRIALVQECARKYVSALPESEVDALVNPLKAALAR